MLSRDYTERAEWLGRSAIDHELDIRTVVRQLEEVYPFIFLLEFLDNVRRALGAHTKRPLFAAGVVSAQLFNSFVWAVRKMQWFLKQGQHHSLDAVGYVLRP